MRSYSNKNQLSESIYWGVKKMTRWLGMLTRIINITRFIIYDGNLHRHSNLIEQII